MKLRSGSHAMLAFVFASFVLALGCSSSDDAKDAGPDLGTPSDTSSVGDTPEVLAAATGRITSALERTVCAPPAQQLIINEVMADPDIVSDTYGEWVEIYNPTKTDVDLLDWRLKDLTAPTPQNHRIGVSLIVPADGYVVLCRNSDPLLNHGVPCNYQYTSFTLTNTGDAVILENPSGVVVDTFAFTGAVPTGASVALRNPYLAHDTLTCPASPNDPASWAALPFGVPTTLFGDAGFENKGTPGARNADVWQEFVSPECNDNNACTTDACVKEACINAVIQDCCLANLDCDDGKKCTQDLCTLATHTCTHTAIEGCCLTNIDCEDGNPCNADYCISGSCRHSAYNILPGCCYAPIDKNPITGVPWVDENERTTFADSQCDDKNFCTPDHCNQATNLCFADAPLEDCCTLPEQCDDNNACTYDLCTNNQCYNPKRSAGCCQDALDCDDTNACTKDECVINQCRHFWDQNACCYNNEDCIAHQDDGNPCTDERCVLNAVSGRYECAHPYRPDCTMDIPYVQPFEGLAGLPEIGWKIKDYASNTQSPTNHWSVTTQGFLGHAHDPADPADPADEHSLLFSWTPTTVLVKSVAMTPFLNALPSQKDNYNVFGQTTVQWRMMYRHSQPGATVSLKVVATASSDFIGGTILGEWNGISEDIPYTLFSVELPNDLKFAQSLKIGFLIDTPTTYNMESFEIDDVKIAAGKPNRFLKAKVYKCPDTGSCTTTTATFVAQSSASDPVPKVPTVTASVTDWYRIYMCMYDPDAYYATWQFFGFPASFMDGSPMDVPPFISASADVGQANGCETLPIAVQTICGVPATSVKGYFVCAVDLKPNGNADYAGSYRSALVVRDEYDPVAPLHSPFESQTKWDTNLMLDSGYIVWSPNGRDDQEAVLLRDAIRANNRQVQIVSDLSLLADLTKFDGIFTTLGIFGKHYKVNPTEAARLKVYLDNGGHLYIEGGDYFFKQTDYDLDDYFKITATSDGVAKLDGPVEGRNFLADFDFNVDQGAQYNFFNDRLTHTPELGGREIFRNAGFRTFATAVSYEGVAMGGTLPYRTIGTSIPFGGLVQIGRTSRELMGKYIDFFENGYPNCTALEQCEDDEVCTDDACGGDERCVNAARPGCIPCLDDEVRIDGQVSCPINQACNVALGYCVDIPHMDRFDTGVSDCSKFFGSGPVTAQCSVTVTKPAALDDIQVKAKVTHGYRGDVEVRLISPQGKTIKLKANNPADSAHNVYYTYDVGVPSAEDMNVVNGDHMEGTWTLVAEDMDPAIYNGLLENWHLFTTQHSLGCTDVSECPTDPCAAKACVLVEGVGECQYTEMDCDDGKDCTIDYCNPDTQECVHDTITGSGCACVTHDHCPATEACLNESLGATCDPIGDMDPVTGLMHCLCSPIEGTPYPLTQGLPVAIPDDDAVTGVTVTLPVDAPGMVNRIKVRLKTNHEAMGDVRARLCHEGVCVTLRNLSGGNAPGFHDVYDFDPVGGPGAITDFQKLPLAGDWTLTVTDNILTGVGDLTGLVLFIVPADCFKSADCEDNNACTVDTCQNPQLGGTCVHTSKVCEPTTDPCQANVCNTTSGDCEVKDQSNGTPCDDGLYCTVDDACVTGVCTGGEPRDCSGMNGNCIVGFCSEDLKQCQPVVAPDGASCDDGEMCTSGDSCSAGLCQPGGTGTCPCPSGLDTECVDDGNLCNGHLWKCNAQKICELTDGPVICPVPATECMRNVCDSYDGVCKLEQELNFMPCEDGLFCSVADYCETGMCLGGTARDCSALDVDCKTGVCDENASACVTTNKADGVSCELDGRGCTVDACTSGTCGYVRNIDCSLVEDDCNDGVCQNVGWGGYVCVKGPLPDGTVCTDEPNPCTDDKCALGLCEHRLLENCNGPCGGEHVFDAGDDDCGKEDSCQGGIAGYPNGACTPTCLAPNCVRAASTLLDLPIDERLTCTVAALDISTAYTYVESVEAKVRLSHGYLGDLTIDIRDPQGYEHRVWNHIGGGNQDFANTFDLSFPVPYPGIPTSGVPMCALAGELASGTWYVKICDTGEGNGGVLHDWKLYVRGSADPALNEGHRCEDAIDLGSHPVVPTITVDGTTLCALNSVKEVNACGGINGLDRLYKFTLTQPRRVTIKLSQDSGRDLILYLKTEAGGTCAPGKLECAQNFPAGNQPEVVDRQLQPGIYYVGVDTEGGPYDYGPFQFDIRIKDLLPDGSYCTGEGESGVVGWQDLDCLSQHCQNDYCCANGDCCPGEAWAVPPDGANPNLVRDTPDWISAHDICPVQYREDPICNDAQPVGVPPVLINTCQGQRHDANCVNHICEKHRVDDDTACDETVHSDPCGLWKSIFCADDGPFPPAAQIKPTCPSYCSADEDCDDVAHCDPAVPTDPDTPASHTMTCQLDLLNGKACNENSDCDSAHCQNGFCCDSGDCCPTDDIPGASRCPGIWTVPPECKDTTICWGERSDPICSNNQCGSVVVRDDCACNGSLSDNCGFFIPVFCGAAPSGTCPATDPGIYTEQPDGSLLAFENGDPQCLTSCLVGGVETDTLCDDGEFIGGQWLNVATCDPCTQDLVDRHLCTTDQLASGDAVCQGAYENGFPCNEAGDCRNKMWLGDPGPAGGHCQNGFCCDFGDCCALPGDCPSGTRHDPVCNTFTTCQGHRMDSACPTTTFSCGSLDVDDDRGCIYSEADPSDQCGYYLSIFCNGEQDQIDPPCPVTCLFAGLENDEACDPNAHCDPDVDLPNQANSICVEDLPNDEACNELSDCVSSFCQIHFCCDPDGCCNGCKVDSAMLALANGGTGSPRTDVLPFNLNEDVSPTAGPGGTPVHVQSAWGLDHPIGRMKNMNDGFAAVDAGMLAGSTVPVFCFDHVRNVTETDVDCGGGLCAKCASGLECEKDSDCLSGTCKRDPLPNPGHCL